MSGQTPPGWYQDPYGTPGLQRYWDGAQWTQATQPADTWEDPALPGQGVHWAQPGGQPPGAQHPGQPPDVRQPGQQGWQPPPGGPAKTNTGLLWALGGGGALVLIILVVVVLLAAGVIGGDPEPTGTAASPGTSQRPSADPTGQSPVTGTITDETAGLAYTKLGGEWSDNPIPETSSFRSTLGFTHGQVAPVQQDYDGPDSSYVASAYSGRLPDSVSYDGPDDLQAANTSFGRSIESQPEPGGSYPTHTRQDLESRAHTVSGKRAWYSKFRLTFPQAESKGWNWRTETVVFVLIDMGEDERPAVFYVSIPDSHQNGGDLDMLVNSLKVA